MLLPIFASVTSQVMAATLRGSPSLVEPDVLAQADSKQTMLPQKKRAQWEKLIMHDSVHLILVWSISGPVVGETGTNPARNNWCCRAPRHMQIAIATACNLHRWKQTTDSPTQP